jgi:hypothetical protein
VGLAYTYESQDASLPHNFRIKTNRNGNEMRPIINSMIAQPIAGILSVGLSLWDLIAERQMATGKRRDESTISIDRIVVDVRSRHRGLSGLYIAQSMVMETIPKPT